jgi:hypothetical protein
MRLARPSTALPPDYTTPARVQQFGISSSAHIETANHCHQAGSGVGSLNEILRPELLRVLLLSVLRARVFWRGEARHLESEY